MSQSFYITKDLVGGGCLHYVSDLYIFDEVSFVVYISLSSRRSEAFIIDDYGFAIKALELLNSRPSNVRKGFNQNGEEITLHFEYKLHKCRKKIERK